MNYPNQQWGQQAPGQQGWPTAPQGFPAGQQQAAAPQGATQSAEDFFASQGGGGVFGPSFFFGAPGATVQGKIVFMEGRQKTDPNGNLRFDKNGKPLMQLVVTLETALRNWEGTNPAKPPTDKDGNPLPPTADDGKRTIYLWYTLRDAVTEAMQKAGVTSLKEGDDLAVRVTGARPNPLGGNAIKEYAAQVRPSSPAADGFFGAQASAANPAQGAAQAQGFQPSGPAAQQGFPQASQAPAPQQAPPGPQVDPWAAAGDPPF